MLTEIEKETRQKDRCRRWHRKMTAERRCHWCGKPSCVEYANACKDHLELSRMITTQSKNKQRRKRLFGSMCADCGRHPARYGYTTCALCGAVHAAYMKRRREEGKNDTLDYFENNLHLINVDEASIILGLHRVTIHQLIDKGVLEVKQNGLRRYWLEESDVLLYDKQRKQRPSVCCRRCNHEWYQVKPSSQLRCPVKGCRSLIIQRLNHNN